MTRRVVIAGNWKMNHTSEETREFFRDFAPQLPPSGEPELLIFPPFLSLEAALQARPRLPRVGIGVQNIHWEEAGAFTGEVSAGMARAAGASHTLVGHSERRQLFGESDEEVARKVEAAFRGTLTPVICVGETLKERKAGRLREVLLRQMEAGLGPLARHPQSDVLLAYEPVWAIGTGETATPEDASEAQGLLRARLREALGEERGDAIPILYGGSVKPGNARDLLQAPDVDGVLVGGASLEAASFAAIAEATVPRA